MGCAGGARGYDAAMAESGTLFGMNPIFVGWLGALLVLGLIDWLRGK